MYLSKNVFLLNEYIWVSEVPMVFVNVLICSKDENYNSNVLLMFSVFGPIDKSSLCFYYQLLL